MRGRLTYANVMATIAVFIALGSTSYAAISITGRDVKNGSLTSVDIRDRSLRARDLAKNVLRAAPTEATSFEGDGQITGTGLNVIATSPTLPAGDYLVVGRVGLLNPGLSTNGASCWVMSGGDILDSVSQNYLLQYVWPMVALVELTQPGTIALSCAGTGGGGAIGKAVALALDE